MTKVGLERLGQLKMEFFHEQIICLECKINMIFFSFLGQNPNFGRKLVLQAPLMAMTMIMILLIKMMAAMNMMTAF